MSTQALLLYVEPNPVLRRLGAAILRDVYTVVPVASIDDPDRGYEPEVIVLDLSNVAGAKGIWGVLTRRWPAVPVVVVTTAAAERDIDMLRALGPVAVVVKPFVPDICARQSLRQSRFPSRIRTPRRRWPRRSREGRGQDGEATVRDVTAVEVWRMGLDVLRRVRRGAVAASPFDDATRRYTRYNRSPQREETQ
jgi:CheY-like chemotaxis protein